MIDVLDLKLRFRYFLGHPAYRCNRLRAWVRLIWWRVQCLLNVPANISLRRWDARFILPPRWGGEGTTMIYVFRDAYETELKYLNRLVRLGDVVVDAGANCGIYTVAAGRLVGATGRIIAVEPTARAVESLRRNIEANALENVRVYPKALSCRDGKVRLFHNRGPVAASITDENIDGAAYDEVETVCLDTVMSVESLSRLDVIKLDIEGAEESALRGGAKAILRWHPCVLFEVNPGATAFRGSRTDGAWNLLSEWGYDFFRMTENGELAHLPSVLEKGNWEFCNFVAVHPGRALRGGRV